MSPRLLRPFALFLAGCLIISMTGCSSKQGAGVSAEVEPELTGSSLDEEPTEPSSTQALDGESLATPTPVVCSGEFESREPDTLEGARKRPRQALRDYVLSQGRHLSNLTVALFESRPGVRRFQIDDLEEARELRVDVNRITIGGQAGWLVGRIERICREP